jgi:hypothetical protein
MKKGSRILVIVGMVALLIVTGYLNVFLNGNFNKTDTKAQAEASADFFATYRTDREAVREQTVMYLNSIINNEVSSDEAIAKAQSDLIKLTSDLGTELKLEASIKSAGFEDVAVSSGGENVNIILKAKDLGDEDVAKVLQIVTSTTGADATNVIIIPVE